MKQKSMSSTMRYIVKSLPSSLSVIRIIPMDVYILRHIQAFLLVFFDKLILATITFQIFILYFGICHTKFYFKNEKNFFLAFFLID